MHFVDKMDYLLTSKMSVLYYNIRILSLLIKCALCHSDSNQNVEYLCLMYDYLLPVLMQHLFL